MAAATPRHQRVAVGLLFESLYASLCRTRPRPRSLPSAGCHPSRVPIFMSVPGTAADVSTSYYDSISTVPGTGPRVRNASEDGSPAHRAPSLPAGGGSWILYPGGRWIDPGPRPVLSATATGSGSGCRISLHRVGGGPHSPIALQPCSPIAWVGGWAIVKTMLKQRQQLCIGDTMWE